VRRSCAVTATIIVLGLLATPCRAFAQGGDFTFFVGSAYPIDRERFTLRPSTPSIPGADVTVTGDPALRATGGLVLGGAAAFELLGVFGIEGRLDSTNLGFDLTGARYGLSGGGLSGAIVVRDAHLDADRFNILSLNARLRTPGPVSFLVSGGFSYLPSVSIAGEVPIRIEVGGLPAADISPIVRLDVTGDSKNRYGFNGGAGLRIGGSRLAVVGEVRAFYFQDYELAFDVDDAPGIVSDLLERIPVIEFNPIIVNAQVGLAVRF